MNAEQATIYALCEPGTAAVRYIGCTRRALDVRLREHIGGFNYDAGRFDRSARGRWLRSLRQGGRRPTIRRLEMIEGDDAAVREREHQLIVAHLEAGCALVNAYGRQVAQPDIWDEVFSDVCEGRIMRFEAQSTDEVKRLRHRVSWRATARGVPVEVKVRGMVLPVRRAAP